MMRVRPALAIRLGTDAKATLDSLPHQSLAIDVSVRLPLFVYWQPGLIKACGANGAFCNIRDGGLIALDPDCDVPRVFAHELAHAIHWHAAPSDYMSSRERAEQFAVGLETPICERNCTSVASVWRLWKELTGEHV
jgi:hypothetical protein